MLLLVVVALLLLGTNYEARLYVQKRVAAQLASSLGVSAHPTVRIGGFPFLWNLLADGKVSSVHVHIGPTSSGSFQVAAVNVTVDRVRVQTSALLDGGAVKVLSAGPADIEAVVTASQISAAVGQPIRLLANGDASMVIFGSPVTMRPSISPGGGIALGVPGVPTARLPLPSPFHLGGCAPSLHISAGQAAFGCHFQIVPQAILQRA